jgi:hypothetical protein
MFYKEIICLAMSRKMGGRCVAGKDVASGQWIRPVSNREGEQLTQYDMSYENKKIPKVLDIIRIPFKKRSPSEFQPENILIDDETYWEYRGEYPKEDLHKLCDDTQEIFVNEEFWNDKVSPEVLIGSGIKQSLLLIRPESFVIRRWDYSSPWGVKRKVRAVFHYGGISYSLGITDPLIEERYCGKKEGNYSLKGKDIYLCISLGKPWEDDGYCYKFVASVIY